MNKYKLVMFDMDGTLLNGKGIFVIAEKLGFYDELLSYFKNKKEMPFYKKSIEIAKLCKGFRKDEFLSIFHNVPLQDNVENIIKNLKKKDIKIAIATDSYMFLAEDLKNRLKIDFAFANNLLTNNGTITGDIQISNKNLISDITGNIYSICKEQTLTNLCKKLGISVNESIAVGDGIVDIGMIKKAGIGIAFNASDKVNEYADVVTKDLNVILDYI
ncbi:MAG: HAD family phosphatase [Candidatus Thermoplasmatota archaeon]|nr:HAD family phosphatase [Candidatus Thermoplasmatota archaeon]